MGFVVSARPRGTISPEASASAAALYREVFLLYIWPERTS